MSLDRYTICPGGTGKKIKFCCNELLNDLQTIDKMLSGEQRLACLEHVEKTLAKYPDRPCLLAVKTLLLSELERDDQLKETLNRFDTVHPHNPVALAERAIQMASTEEGRAAVAPLQRALQNISGKDMPTRVYAAVGFVGESLVQDGEILAGRAHLLLQANIAGGTDADVMRLLASLIASPDVPQLLKQDLRLEEPPPKVPWLQPFQEACNLAARGAWRAAEQKLAALVEKSHNAPAVWKNLSVLRSWLADTNAAVAAWQKYASLEDVAIDDAVEACAIAHLIDTNLPQEMVDLLSVTYPVHDQEDLLGKLNTAQRAARVQPDALAPTEPGQPPPQAAFWILDRPMPASGVGLARNDVPIVLGQAYLFGRETDRKPRLEYVLYQDDRFANACQTLRELAGDALADADQQTALTQVTRLQVALTWNWRFPADTPPAHRAALLLQQRDHILRNVWTSLPNPMLDGKTPREAAADTAYRPKLLAAILLLQMARDEPQSVEDFNGLRRELGLPEIEPIDPTGIDVAKLPVTRLERLLPDKLTDQQLIDCYQRSVASMLYPAIRRLGPELISRDSLRDNDRIKRSAVYGLLARIEHDSQQALQHLENARQAASEAGESLAPWYVAELELRMIRGERDEFERVLNLLRTNYWHEPGVADAVLGLFQHLQASSGEPAAGQPAAAGKEEEIGRPEKSSEIWTPQSATAGQEKKSAIWTPDF
ncbi:MAG: hypothetical protein GTO53_04570 [Planctomycetales bacterium]|nr:hypothetical protein [Planctomycetales bacterium]NIM08431.1 hypothetical protein [Planctomycetales bacterium]NIN07907.1 hypothetical protein [Planctomycetales bacterium]NIN77037.1 hypothetical protein [Planctomycetales bacterium]NIO34219.1 hypothetical protein [Planctomycetales bacterium]